MQKCPNKYTIKRYNLKIFVQNFRSFRINYRKAQFFTKDTNYRNVNAWKVVLRKRRNGRFSFNGLDIIPQPDSTRLWRGIMARARRTNTEIEIRQWIDEGRRDRYWYGTMWTGKPGARTLSSTKQTRRRRLNCHNHEFEE